MANPLIDSDSELGIIGCCLLGGLEIATDAIEVIPSVALVREDCREAFDVIGKLVEQGGEINGYTFGIAWSQKHKTRKIPEAILTAPDKIPSASNLQYYVGAVLENWRRARVFSAGTLLQTKANDKTCAVDELLSEAETILYGEEITKTNVYDNKKATTLFIDDMQRRFDSQGKRTGIETGFLDLDKLIDGLQYGEQSIIAARPSMGKTAIGVNIVEYACLRNKIPTAVVSLEMSTQALMRRLLSSWGSIPMNTLKTGQLSEENFATFNTFNRVVKDSPLYMIDAVSGADIKQLSASIRRLSRKHKVKLVVIDYLQKIKSHTKQEKRTYEIGEVSGILKGLAVSINAAFLTLAQLNREPEKDKGRTPRLSDLADSGQIERDADMVGLLHRDRAKNNGAEAALYVAKQRDGEIGKIDLVFNGKYCKFNNAAKEVEDIPDPGREY